MIGKGTISAIYGNEASIKPYTGDVVTERLVIPFYLRGDLQVGVAVVYAAFEDCTGVILARMDGEWSHKLEGGVEIEGDIKTGGVASVNAHTHTSPADGGKTSGPT